MNPTQQSSRERTEQLSSGAAQEKRQMGEFTKFLNTIADQVSGPGIDSSMSQPSIISGTPSGTTFLAGQTRPPISEHDDA